MRILSALLFSSIAIGCATGWTANDEGHPGNSTPGAGGSSTDSSYTGGNLGVPLDPTCTPGATRSCYGGPAPTSGIGACTPGTQICAADGAAWGPCNGEVTPTPEICQTPEDDDCDGIANEDCACAPGDLMPCYTGPAGTNGVGICKGGVSTCAWDGQSWLPCFGEVTPLPAELCETPEDDDCDGAVDDDNTGCPENTTCQDRQCVSHCVTYGILDCPSGVCMPKLICGSQGGPLICGYVWSCIP